MILINYTRKRYVFQQQLIFVLFRAVAEFDALIIVNQLEKPDAAVSKKNRLRLPRLP